MSSVWVTPTPRVSTGDLNMLLSDVIATVRSATTPNPDLWLYISGAAGALALETDCDLAVPSEDEETDVEILPEGFAERGLRPALDYQTVEDCVRWADRLAGGQDPAACCEVIRYYVRFDAWPETLGAGDPPPIEDITARLDREFYDSLGAERPGTQCRRTACGLGTVEFSVLCPSHHFESIKNKPCPFSD